MNKILIVDDDRKARRIIRENLLHRGFAPVEASSGMEAIEMFNREKPTSVILDLKMPGIDGITTLKELKKIDPDIPVIINTAHGDIPTAVEAIQLGAYDFVVKPPDYNKLAITLMRAGEKLELGRKLELLSSEVETSLEYLCGKSEAMKKVISQITLISQSDFSLIIQGETGTGKSFISRHIHNMSRRADGPFVTVDIGSIPETLIESELFGYVKGAFTGAEKNRKGYFEMAGGGTILFDELQNLSPYVQGKLLMALEEREVYPLGSGHPVKIDVHIIGATNTDILGAVKERKFREDLFYRLSEFIICLPPLRERVEDITFLAEKFIREASEDLDRPALAISQDALLELKKYPWPGNIRELKNVIRRTVLLSEGTVIKPEHLQFLIRDRNNAAVGHGMLNVDVPLNLSLEEVEKDTIRKTLQLTQGNKTKAAEILKINYTTLLRKLKAYNILP